MFFGWWVALSFSAMVFISTGIRFTVGPFLKPIVADLGLDRASFSLVISLGLFLYGAFMPFVGTLVDRFGARAVTVGGTLVLAGSVAATGGATKLWHLYVLYGVLMALGLAATGHVVASAVIARWFVRRRATALSLLGGASMAGMSLLVPIVMWLILTFGWRASFVIIAVGLFVVMMPMALFVVRETPEAMGLTPDGVAVPPTIPGAAVMSERTDMGMAVQTVSFWQIAGGLFTCGFSMSLLSAHGVPMLTDHGYGPMLASWAIGVLGFSSMVCAMILGVIADRLGRRPVLAWLYGTRAILFALLFLVRDQPMALLAIVALGGVTMSGTLAMGSALTADIFGRFSVGSVFGAIFLVHQAGSASGSWLAGYLFEVTGGYGAAFVAACVFLLLASVLSLTIDERFRCAPRLQPVTGGR
ncbi:MAG: MFS transporter [Candidatus Rokubacteria bacterium]|nr:MFS transporter [Candidatus Rokubacteria bacterium]